MSKRARFIVEPVVNPRSELVSLEEQIEQRVNWWRTTTPDGTWFFDKDRDTSVRDAQRWYYFCFPNAGPAAVDVHEAPR